MRQYPIGIQDFARIINRNMVYVDKTDLVYQLASSEGVYFLSRPRRFGKSLLVSTLKYYFQGRVSSLCIALASLFGVEYQRFKPIKNVINVSIY